MFFYALSIFVSAFLLFQIQPMMGKLILPWFGGTPAVWSTTMLFFQIMLTGGYAYAYWLIGRVPVKRQSVIHIAILAIAVALMIGLGARWASPITPAASWKPQTVDVPVWNIFKLLFISVGLPYFMLATNSTLTQAWFGRAFPNKSPYALYALSNAGSLIGLIAYPILVEPNLALKAQGWAWAGGFMIFAALAGFGVLRSGRAAEAAGARASSAHQLPQAAPLKISTQLMWIALSMTASALLLAVTNQITQEVAPIPFLWVLPLTLYLLSFILTFSSERWYVRPIFSVLLLLSAIGFVWVLLNPIAYFMLQIVLYVFVLFVSVMICHGELYRLRPDPSHLTRFYLLVSVGGALGGIVVNLVAPLVFKGYWELNVAFTLVFVLLALLTFMRPTTGLPPRGRFAHDALIGALAMTFVIFTGYYMKGIYSDTLVVQRNFYGIIRVKAMNANRPGEQGYIMAHGVITHGFQFAADDKRDMPTTYYTEAGGAGLAILNHPKYGKGMRVGVLGLGVGTLAAYGQPGDDYRLYEINPVVMNLAQGQGGYFSFLKDSKAVIHAVLGDARISLERELAQHGSNRFDILILDTFSSDSIPVHLVTREAFDLYLQHLAPDGILAAHITNQHLDLRPVFYQLAQAYDLKMVVIQTNSGDNGRTYPSIWVLTARDGAVLDLPQIAARAEDSSDYANRSIRVWTDDYSNLFQILK